MVADNIPARGPEAHEHHARFRNRLLINSSSVLIEAQQPPRPCARPVEKAGVANIVWYNYRRVPAVTLAKQLIDEGKLGRIFHYRANFLQDWTISRRPAARRRRRCGGSTSRPPAAA